MGNNIKYVDIVIYIIKFFVITIMTDIVIGSLTIKKFQLEDIIPSAHITIIGNRQRGKSHLIKNILYHHQTIPAFLVVNPREEMEPFYSHFVPKLFIHPTLEPDTLSRVFHRQHSIMKKKQHDSRAIIVMDDCISSSTFFKDPKCKEMIMNGRRLNLSSILTLQFPLNISPEIRINMDYIFLFGTENEHHRKRIYEQYAGFFPTFAKFNEIFQEITSSPYRCMVIKNAVPCFSDVSDMLFWFEAEFVPDFYMTTNKE